MGAATATAVAAAMMVAASAAVAWVVGQQQLFCDSEREAAGAEARERTKLLEKRVAPREPAPRSGFERDFAGCSRLVRELVSDAG